MFKMNLLNQTYREEAVFLLFVSLSCIGTVSPEETSTVSYEKAHELAVTAFEVLSPLESTSNKNTPHRYVANEIMDMALEKVRGIIIKDNMDRVKIPDFTEPFQRDLGFIKLSGNFKGTDGWFESLLSITRRGDAVVHVDGTSLALDARLGLNTLHLGMKFQVEFLGIKPNAGDITGRVRSNNVMLSAGMDFATGQCDLRLRNLKITDLGKIDVDVTGYGELDWLATHIASWVTDRAHARIQEAVDHILNDLLKKELGRIDCPAL